MTKKTYDIKIVKRNIRNYYELVNPGAGNIEQIINNIVADNDLKSGDVIEIDIVSVKDGENN